MVHLNEWMQYRACFLYFVKLWMTIVQRCLSVKIGNLLNDYLIFLQVKNFKCLIYAKYLGVSGKRYSVQSTRFYIFSLWTRESRNGIFMVICFIFQRWTEHRPWTFSNVEKCENFSFQVITRRSFIWTSFEKYTCYPNCRSPIRTF